MSINWIIYLFIIKVHLAYTTKSLICEDKKLKKKKVNLAYKKHTLHFLSLYYILYYLNEAAKSELQSPTILFWFSKCKNFAKRPTKGAVL